MRVLLIASAGGHLAQLLALRPWWQDRERHWVTREAIYTTSALAGEANTYGHFPTTRNLPNLARNWRQARGVLASFQPDLIVSTGAALAVPYFMMARRHKARTMYLEVVDRVDSATLTGRIVYPFTDDFCVQWPEQLRMYPEATVVGPVI